MAKITYAGESLIAQKLGAGAVLNIARFIFANVPGLDPQQPINRAEVKPPAGQIVHTYTIPAGNSGYVNPNQVVYSSMLGSDLGDFDFNWMGLESTEGVLFAVAYLPVQQKRKNIPPAQIGNNITRNILVEFSGAQELTGITINANTWQHDFTVRLAGIDERERMSNRDMFGRACFFGSAFQVEKVGAGYQVKPGLAYVEGVRLHSTGVLPVPGKALPTTVWLDVVFERQLNDVVARWSVICESDKADYRDALGVQHYCIPLANLTGQAIENRRFYENINGPLIYHLAAQTGDYELLRARATTKEDVGLSNVPNAVSDEHSTDSSEILATTKAVHRAHVEIDYLIRGQTSAGNAKKLTNARKIAIHGRATGAALFDGSADISIELELANNGVVPGTYPKVVVDSKGLVTGSEALTEHDIPNLPWSKINSLPTTLFGYGITDALRAGYNSQVPRFYSPAVGTTYATPALELREANLVGSSNTDWKYAPRLGFHWGGLTGGDLSMSAEGVLCWNMKQLYHAGNFDPNSKADKATTLDGYGITDALRTGYSNQVPRFYAPQPGADYNATALEIRETGLVEGATREESYAPRMSFLWGMVNSGVLSMTADGYLRWNGNRVWDTSNFDPAGKANKATTLAGYGITDALRTGYSNQVPRFYAPQPGADYNATALEIRETGLVEDATREASYAPRMSFLWGMVNSGVLSMTADGYLRWNGMRIWDAGNFDPSAIVPAGTVVMHAMSAAPSGYLKANGAAVSRTTYSRLFAVISTYYGAGDGVSTFNLPDLRGEFPRGWDDNRGVDPNRVFGSVQLSQNLMHNHYATASYAGAHGHDVAGTAASAGEHTHSIKKASMGNNTVGAYISPANEGASSSTTDAAGAHTHTVTGTAAAVADHTHTIDTYYEGGSEARPRNIALLACIKY